MRSREQLQEQYDDALFALLMEDTIDAEGNIFIAENERLKSDDHFMVPEQIDERSRKTIEQAFKANKRKTRKENRKQISKRTLAAVLAVVFIFGVSYFTVPEVKASTLSLVMKISDRATDLFFDKGNKVTIEVEHKYFPYSISYIPEGFICTNEFNGERLFSYEFAKEDNTIMIQLHHDTGNLVHRVDSEDADILSEIQINDRNGIYIEKDSTIYISLFDTKNMNYIDVVCEGIDSDTVIEIAEGIREE